MSYEKMLNTTSCGLIRFVIPYIVLGSFLPDYIPDLSTVKKWGTSLEIPPFFFAYIRIMCYVIHMLSTTKKNKKI